MQGILTMEHKFKGARPVGQDMIDAAAKGATFSKLRGMSSDLRAERVAGMLTDRALSRSVKDAEAKLQSMLSHPFTIPGSKKVKYATRTLEVLKGEMQRRRDERSEQRKMQRQATKTKKKKLKTGRERRTVIHRTVIASRGLLRGQASVGIGEIHRRQLERQALLNSEPQGGDAKSWNRPMSMREQPRAKYDGMVPKERATGGNGIAAFARQPRFYSAREGLNAFDLESAVRKQFLSDGKKPEELDRLAAEALAGATEATELAVKNALAITAQLLRDQARTMRENRGK